jgi:uncharacterized membrane protein
MTCQTTESCIYTGINIISITFIFRNLVLIFFEKYVTEKDKADGIVLLGKI